MVSVQCDKPDAFSGDTERRLSGEQKLLGEYKKNNESKMKDSDYLFYNADVRNAVLME